MLKAAIIGCGAIAQVHKQVLLSIQEAELVACCDIKPERAEKFAASCNLRAYTSVEEMLDREQPDVVHLCVPHPLHTPLAVLCAKRGVHVFTEKPPVVNEKQWLDFAALGKEQARIGICFQNRYNHSAKRVKELLTSGTVGNIQGARAFLTWHREPEYYLGSDWRGSWQTEGGGVLINQAIHTLDLLVWLMGSPTGVRSHMCNHSLQKEIEVEDTLEANISFASGANALLYATNAYCCNAPVLIELACEQATVRLERDILTIIWADGHADQEADRSAAFLGKDYWGSSHLACIQDFYRAIQENRPYQNDIPSVRDTMTLMLQMYSRVRGTKVGVE